MMLSLWLHGSWVGIQDIWEKLWWWIVIVPVGDVANANNIKPRWFCHMCGSSWTVVLIGEYFNTWSKGVEGMGPHRNDWTFFWTTYTWRWCGFSVEWLLSGVLVWIAMLSTWHDKYFVTWHQKELTRWATFLNQSFSRLHVCYGFSEFLSTKGLVSMFAHQKPTVLVLSNFSTTNPPLRG